MNRRAFFALGAAAAAWPMEASAQQAPAKIRRIGFLSSNVASRRHLEAFRLGLQDLGWVEGQNIVIDYRFADNRYDRLPGLADELVGRKVELIVTHSIGVRAAQQATSTIPIVMAVQGGDVLSARLADSLARPGGNITGSTFFNPELMAKRLELLREVAPSISRVGVLLPAGMPGNAPVLEAMMVIARALRLDLFPIEVSSSAELGGAFARWIEKRADGVVIQDHPQFLPDYGTIATLSAKHLLPSIGDLELPKSGGLIAYGVDFGVLWHRAAYFVDKILNGTVPADLPIEQPTKFALAINLKAAKALNLIIAESLLARADEVIE